MSPVIEVVDLTSGCGPGKDCGGELCSCRPVQLEDRRRLPAVLLVDDDPEFLSALADVLRQTGRCEVLTAESSAAALVVLREITVAAVVADHHMPGGDGAGLLQHVRRHYPGVSRLFMTGLRENEGLAGALAAAINRGRSEQYLPKSMEPHRMVAAILRELPNGQPS